jgi:hypothetical protein
MKLYQKPVLLKVELVADQAVLGNCKKTQLAVGPSGGGGDCQTTNGMQCQLFGS